MDVTQALRDAENALRDFIGSVLTRKLGNDWIDKCGVAPERIEKWKERKVVEEKRQESGAVEERLLYYADFYDLKTILKKNWDGEFSAALGDWKTLEVYLTELEKLRDPDAHRRELLPHQKLLVGGIAGTIRTMIARYRSKMETADDCFPRIESARDSLGNVWTSESGPGYIRTHMNLRPGTAIDFVVTATDPNGDLLQYRIIHNHDEYQEWQNGNELAVKVRDCDIGKSFEVSIEIRSNKPYHAHTDCDDFINFVYTVLPPVARVGETAPAHAV